MVVLEDGAFLSCRASSVALVCKFWHEADRRYPEHLTELTVEREDCNTSYLTWHLRSSRKLVELKLCACTDDTMELCSLAFSHLSNQAPALRVLEFLPPASSKAWGINGGVEHHLSMLGRLTQLKELSLHSWGYKKDDIPLINKLTSLIDLEVDPTSKVVKPYQSKTESRMSYIIFCKITFQI